MNLNIVVGIVSIHDVREHYPCAVTTFLQLDVAGESGCNPFIMIQSVFQVSIAIGLHEVVQGMDAVCGNSVFFACGNEDNLALGILFGLSLIKCMTLHFAGKLDSVYMLHINIKEHQVVYFVLHGV